MGDQEVAQIIVNSLYNAGVRVAFGIPGAKIDALFDCLQDHPEIKLIICRHEQNAAMMAAATGRITGVPGVCIATSGPGASNLATGLVTATTEGDPVVALIGSVPRVMNTHRTHQSMKALEILGPTCKTAASIDVEDQTAEVILSSFRSAATSPRGANVISIPIDVAKGKSKFGAFPPDAFKAPPFGLAAEAQREKALHLIQKAKHPVLFLGLRASGPRAVAAIRQLLQKFPLPTVETFQAAGAVSKDLAHLFYGRVGLFRNQVGDKVLAKSDLVIAVGYDPVEYDAGSWNPEGKFDVIHMDFQASDYGVNYRPVGEMLGSIPENISYLTENLKSVANWTKSDTLTELSKEHTAWRESAEAKKSSGLVHPLHFIANLQDKVAKDTTVCCDIGTCYIYMMRYYFAYEPRRLLCSDGQQTLGVGLPTSIASCLSQDPPCSQKVIGLGGDGGFMFSSQEMSTAVQQGCDITYFIWNDSAYNMVQFQEELKFGRSSGIALGGVDFVKFAESFGAKGFRIKDASELDEVMSQALAHKGVSLVDVAIDYSNNKQLAQHVIANEWN